MTRHAEPVMGTVFSFDVREDPGVDPGVVERALADAVAWLHQVDATFSTYRPGSVISRLGRGELDLADCPPDVADVLDRCAAAETRTGGYFTMTPGGALDPSAMVKGWAIERASQILLKAGLVRHSVNGGGDVRLRGEPEPGRPWRVGVAHPLRPGRLAAVITGRDLAVATSGTAERGAHIVDPHTGRPPTALASITLVGADMTETDSMATAAFAMGEAAREWVEDQDGLEALAVTATGHTWRTSGFARHTHA
ncbi:FAD:protein FMN transferase [Thermopolyspora sp. NPDC052614]|uniref:FAD:protein FMN transferase n=1 Tax=Thermopolyspora sp. NPDC052614 TaxID=3155682 RepID=UPI00342D98CC